MKLCQHVTQRRAPPPAPLLLRYVASDRGGHTTGDFIDMIHARHQTDCHPLTAPAAGIERATQMRICEYIRNDLAFPECDRSGVLERFGNRAHSCSRSACRSSWRFFETSCLGCQVCPPALYHEDAKTLTTRREGLSGNGWIMGAFFQPRGQAQAGGRIQRSLRRFPQFPLEESRWSSGSRSRG
jgi:hypothetical protein